MKTLRRIQILGKAGASQYYDVDQSYYVQWFEMKELLGKYNWSVEEFSIEPSGFTLIFQFVGEE